MEGLTRLVSESLVRHGLDRPVDYRRLRWSRWFRCESHHSLLLVPSKPGVFALAEEILDFSTGKPAVLSRRHVSVEEPEGKTASKPNNHSTVEPPAGLVHDRSCEPVRPSALESDAPSLRRMLAITRFFEDEDMAFTLDRMLTRENPMRAALASGRYFIRFVIMEDRLQRRQIYNELAQWLAESAEKASGIGAHFAGSLELTPATEYSSVSAATLLDEKSAALTPTPAHAGYAADSSASLRTAVAGRRTAVQFDSGAVANIHCPSPLPSGF